MDSVKMRKRLRFVYLQQIGQRIIFQFLRRQFFLSLSFFHLFIFKFDVLLCSKDIHILILWIRFYLIFVVLGRNKKRIFYFYVSFILSFLMYGILVSSDIKQANLEVFHFDLNFRHE